MQAGNRWKKHFETHVEFAALHTEIRRIRKRRNAWLAGLLALLLVALVVAMKLLNDAGNLSSIDRADIGTGFVALLLVLGHFIRDFLPGVSAARIKDVLEDEREIPNTILVDMQRFVSGFDRRLEKWLPLGAAVAIFAILIAKHIP